MSDENGNVKVVGVSEEELSDWQALCDAKLNDVIGAGICIKCGYRSSILPLYLSEPQIKALQAGTLSLVFVPMKVQPLWREAPNNGVSAWYPAGYDDGKSLHYASKEHFIKGVCVDFSPYHPGDILAVKEPWCNGNCGGPEKKICTQGTNPPGCSWQAWRSPVTMPQWAARHFAKVEDVQAVRVHDISTEKCVLAGLDRGVVIAGKYYPNAGLSFSMLSEYWKKYNRRYPWESNPWAWLITIKKTVQS